MPKYLSYALHFMECLTELFKNHAPHFQLYKKNTYSALVGIRKFAEKSIYQIYLYYALHFMSLIFSANIILLAKKIILIKCRA